MLVSLLNAFNLCFRELRVECFDELWLSNLILNDEVHQCKHMLGDLGIVSNIECSRMDLLVPYNSDDVEGLLHFRGQSFSNEASDILVDIFARFTKFDAELLDT